MTAGAEMDRAPSNKGCSELVERCRYVTGGMEFTSVLRGNVEIKILKDLPVSSKEVKFEVSRRIRSTIYSTRSGQLMLIFLLQLLFTEISSTTTFSSPTNGESLYQSTKALLPENATFLDILERYVEISPPQVPAQVSGARAWYKKWARNYMGRTARPFRVRNAPLWWPNHSNFSCAEIIRSHGDLHIDYQFAGTGWLIGSKEEKEAQNQHSFSMSHCARRIPSCQVPWSEIERPEDIYILPEVMQRFLKNNLLSNVSGVPPYLLWPSNRTSGQHLYADLKAAGYFDRTPTYVEANLINEDADKLLRALFNDSILLPLRNTTYDDTLSDQDLKSALYLPTKGKLSTVFMYIGDAYSGTFMHNHGSSCTRTTGKRLWMLFKPEEYCYLNNTGIPKHLPKRCPRLQGGCIDGLHPLDVLAHYFELKALGVAPRLYMQQPGELFCFPANWYHGTLNFEPNVAMAVVLKRDSTASCELDDEEAKAWGVNSAPLDPMEGNGVNENDEVDERGAEWGAKSEL